MKATNAAWNAASVAQISEQKQPSSLLERRHQQIENAFHSLLSFDFFPISLPCKGAGYHTAAPPQAPRIRLASWMSFCMMVTLLAWMAHRLTSSKRWTRKASAAS